MADVGGLECAAGLWLQRLCSKEKLPPKGTLEMLRRRELGARERAEALADAERRCSLLTQERLDDERRLGSRCKEALTEAEAALRVERQKRLDAEAALARMREEQRRTASALAAEAAKKEAAERARKVAEEEIAELRVLAADDRALVALEEFREKLEAGRSEVAALRQRLGLAEEGARAQEAALEGARRDIAAAQAIWKRQDKESEV
mmetsp:Transcript_70252/g.157864  ORF Transcript_70252/g.157864 Transcript_70252/m.157864 type:complete len:207 (+) Transcript_70252:69-689(+)